MNAKAATAIVAAILTTSLAIAQKVVNVKPGSPDYKVVIQQVSPFVVDQVHYALKLDGATMRRWKDWIFMFSPVTPTDSASHPKASVAAILRKGRKWTIREITMGSSALEDIEADWQKRYKLPDA